ALLGMVRFGPVKLGAASVLFVGLFVGALDEDIAAAVPAGISALGLALYVYTVGLESGPSFFRELRGQLAVMAGAVVALALTAVLCFVAMRNSPVFQPNTDPVLPKLKSALKLPVTWEMSFLYAVVFGGFVAFTNYLPTYIKT
nr:hypothetical protein [Streptomyces sp. DSM 41633]